MDTLNNCWRFLYHPFLLFAILIFSTASYAQQSRIEGRVADEEGNPIPFANVMIQGTFIGAAAKADGTYGIENVPAGEHTVQASAVGYKTELQSATVASGETVTVNFTLRGDILRMDMVVVSGTPGGAGMRKRDASFAITTMEAADIAQFSPASTANLMELIPGVWSESSGGIAGANIDVRGLPGGGDAPFVTMSLNGAPLYGTQMLSFFEQSTIFRVDETVASAEALRGGPNSVFSSGETGVTMNFNLLRGADETRGRLKYSTSDYNLQRVDAVLSGRITEGLYYMAGGYARTSPGIRTTQFNAERGQQFTVQLTKVFDKGVLNAFTRMTDDHGQWILPMSLVSDNDLGTFAQLGTPTRFRELRLNAEGDTQIFDFSRGRGWKGSVSGMNAHFDLGSGWTVRDNLSYTTGEANTFGFVPDGAPIRVSALGLPSVETLGGRTLGGNEWIQNYGHWVVLKDIESFTNDISLARIRGDHDITVGFYQAWWSARDFWTLGNFTPVHNVANGDFLESGIDCTVLAQAGSGSGCWAYGIQSAGDARVLALYASESWRITPLLRLDVAVRQEWFELEYVLDAGPGYPDGSRDMVESVDDSKLALTAAVNFDITDEIGVYARYSDGFKFPHFDFIREGNFQTSKIRQYEAGVKFDPRQYFSLFATAYFTQFDAFESLVGGEFDPRAFKTESMGVEIDGAFVYDDLTVRVISTIQNAEITESSGAPDLVGNKILRQPDWQVRLAPSYTVALGDFNLNLYAAMRLVGDRWGDNDNLVPLDGYEKIDLGVTVLTGTSLSFNLHFDNLTDSDGLTEGDPRDPAAANGRPIFGRSIMFSVGYDL